MRLLLLSVLLISCVTTRGGYSPPLDRPETKAPVEPGIYPKSPKGTPRTKTEDQVFIDESDACFVTYRACQKVEKESVCFPPQEKCMIVAYRKLLEARKASEQH